MSKDANQSQEALKEAIDYIEKLSHDEMKEWLTTHLHGRDVLLPDRSGESLAYSAAAIYPLLSRHAREDLLSATMVLLNDLAQGKGWSGEPAEELLLLVQHLVPEDAGDLLAAVVQSKRFQQLDADLRFRMLQTLVSLRVAMSPEFWRAALMENRTELAGLAFDGLALDSIEQAVGILPLLPDDENVAELITNALPGIIDIGGPNTLDRLHQLLSDMQHEMNPLLKREIASFLAEEGRPLVDRAGVERPGRNLKVAELKEICYTLSPGDTSLGSPACARL